jgi:hypothetical protein
MIDPLFDPYEQLQKHEHLIAQLIAANNHLQDLMLDLTQQHQQLVQHSKSNKQLLLKLTIDLELIKNNLNHN